jgi:hypothetical protein
MFLPACFHMVINILNTSKKLLLHRLLAAVSSLSACSGVKKCGENVAKSPKSAILAEK